jgi:hypothetical protein
VIIFGQLIRVVTARTPALVGGIYDLLLFRIHRSTQMLPFGERIQAEQFYFEKDGKYFIVRRGLQIKILVYFLNNGPTQ